MRNDTSYASAALALFKREYFARSLNILENTFTTNNDKDISIIHWLVISV